MSAQNAPPRGRILLLGDDIYVGGKNIKGWVAMPKPTWEGVVAKRIVADTLLYFDRVEVAMLAAQAHDDSVKIALKNLDVLAERKLKNQAYQDTEDCKTENGKLTKKLKRRTPWAWAAKIQVGAIVVFGGYTAYKAIAP